MTIIHALHEGSRLCAPGDPTVPGDWPPGHLWVGVADWPGVAEQPSWTPAHRRCPACDAVVRRAHADGRPVGQVAEQVRFEPPPCLGCERLWAELEEERQRWKDRIPRYDGQCCAEVKAQVKRLREVLERIGTPRRCTPDETMDIYMAAEIARDALATVPEEDDDQTD